MKKERMISPARQELEKLRTPLTSGERKVFDFFDQNLPCEWEIYVQPHLNGLRPDFVLLNPNVGIAVFEVKDWDLDAMRYSVRENPGSCPVLWAEKDGIAFCKEKDNPVKKVYEYKDEIFNIYCPRLRKRSGFSAITAGVIFPYAEDDRVKKILAPCLKYRCMDKAIAYNPVSGREALAQGDMKAIFPEGLRQSSIQMNAELISDLRNWLVEPDMAAVQRQPVTLDRNQISFVKTRTQNGYRRIRGAAGSGKSLVLAARAAELLSQGKSVLVVTFNITLLHYLKDVAVRCKPSKEVTITDITWLNFHLWCKRVCIENNYGDEYDLLWPGSDPMSVLNKALPDLVIRILIEENITQKYDAVLVDEGQDFHLSWWAALRMVCKEGGEMLLVADVTQDIYGTASAWTDEAMTGAGFSGRWAELDVSYRMPKAALEMAAEFARRYLPEAARILPINNQEDLALESCDLRWVQTSPQFSTWACREEIMRLFTTDNHEHYSFADATFLCNSRTSGIKVVEQLVELGIKCVHTYDMDDKESRRQKVGFYMGDARVKATTLHSFKGWESRSLVIHIGQRMSAQSLALLYTGLTRVKAHPQGSSLTVVSSSLDFEEYGKSWPDYQRVGI